MTGKLAPGYYLEPVEANPPSATIFGDPSVLAGVTTVETEPIDVTGLASTSVRPVFLRAASGVTFLQPRPVNVTLRVTPIQTTQVLQVTPTLTGLASGLALTDPLPLVEVTISGPAPSLQGLSARDFRITLDLSGRGPGTYQVTLQPQIPATFRLESINPRDVSVTLRALPTPTPFAAARLREAGENPLSPGERVGVRAGSSVEANAQRPMFPPSPRAARSRSDRSLSPGGLALPLSFSDELNSRRPATRA